MSKKIRVSMMINSLAMWTAIQSIASSGKIAIIDCTTGTF
jgi:hypothetical protein